MTEKPVDHGGTTDENLRCINGPNGDKGKYRNGPVSKYRSVFLNVAMALRTLTVISENTATAEALTVNREYEGIYRNDPIGKFPYRCSDR